MGQQRRKKEWIPYDYWMLSSRENYRNEQVDRARAEHPEMRHNELQEVLTYVFSLIYICVISLELHFSNNKEWHLTSLPLVLI